MQASRPGSGSVKRRVAHVQDTNSPRNQVHYSLFSRRGLPFQTLGLLPSLCPHLPPTKLPGTRTDLSPLHSASAEKSVRRSCRQTCGTCIGSLATDPVGVRATLSTRGAMERAGAASDIQTIQVSKSQHCPRPGMVGRAAESCTNIEYRGWMATVSH